MRFFVWFIVGMVVSLLGVFVLVSSGGAILPTQVATVPLSFGIPTGSSGVTSNNPALAGGNTVLKGSHTRIGPIVIVWP